MIQELQKAAAREACLLPAGLLHLHRLARELTGLYPTAPQNLRVVVTVPTLRLASVAAALGGALADIPCRDCPHTQLERGVQVTGWASGEFVDAPLSVISDDELMFRGMGLRGNRESVHRLPYEFPERRRYRLPKEERTEIAAALGCAEGVAGQRLSASAAHPVVIAGEPSIFRNDVDELATACPGLHLHGRMHSGGQLHDWFRHPVLLMGAVPVPEDVPWAKELRPRLVVISGSAAWLGSSRRNWPDVPVLVLLPRRSPAACDAAGLVRASGWASPASIPAPLESLLRPTAGLEVQCRIEPEATADNEDLW